MKIENIKLKNFMLFEDLNVDFSPGINIISGENSTGKTALIKIMYSMLKGYSTADNQRNKGSKELMEQAYVNKLQGVFRPDDNSIGRLVMRKQGSNSTSVHLGMEKDSMIDLAFGNRQEKHLSYKTEMHEIGKNISSIYIPPKEIISAMENFGALYDQYNIAFEETYYDLCRLLEKPLTKGAKTAAQKQVMERLENIVSGNIVQKDHKFYLKRKNAGEFEMGLVSEGYRKLSTIMYLILSGSLNKNAILFWDEPEANMNPAMIKPLTDVIIELAKLGVQVFVTTHNYFIQQSFNLVSEYDKKSKVNIRYYSLYDENGKIEIESEEKLSNIQHNTIMDEFNKLYDREQEMAIGNFA